MKLIRLISILSLGAILLVAACGGDHKGENNKKAAIAAFCSDSVNLVTSCEEGLVVTEQEKKDVLKGCKESLAALDQDTKYFEKARDAIKCTIKEGIKDPMCKRQKIQKEVEDRLKGLNLTEMIKMDEEMKKDPEIKKLEEEIETISKKCELPSDILNAMGMERP